MGKFVRGFVLGIIFSLLMAPMRGQEMRRLLSKRMQKLREYLPDTMPLEQSAQQTINKASQLASNVSSAVQQANSQVKQTGKDLASTTQQVATSVQQSLQHNAPPVVVAPEHTETVEGEEASIDPLERIHDVVPGIRTKLEAEGIQNTSQLLEHTQTKAQRVELAQKVGVSNRILREFVYRADLMRLKNLGEDLAHLLEEAGINGCKDLQQRNPDHLHAKLLEIQESSNMASSIPDVEQIAMWIAEAKEIAQSTSE